MSASNHFLPFTPVSKQQKTPRYEIKREMQHYEYIKVLSECKETIEEKDLLIKSQRNTIKLYEKKIENLERNNNSLKQIIGILSKHITDELNEILPPLPNIPDDNFKLAPIVNQNFKHQRKSQSIDLASAMNNISQTQKIGSQSVLIKNFLFDSALQNSLFQDFREAEFLKCLVDAQLCREEMQKVVKFLLGKTSQDLFLFKTRTILFESLSFFLSLRNVAFLNCYEVFLPRSLEMMMDILEVEKITVLAYNEEKLYSVAVTSEVPQAIEIPKNFGHFAYVIKDLIINSAYEDDRFDKTYDQICNFITRNVACVQIKLEDQVLGILECTNKQKDFTYNDLSLMTHISSSLALSQVGLDIKEKLTKLYNRPAINRGTIESCKESLIMPVFNKIIETILELIHCERASIFLYNDQTKELVSVLATGIDGVIRIPASVGVVGLAFITNSVINTDTTHSNFYPEIDKKVGFVTKEILVVPMKNIGAIQCLNKTNMNPFGKIDEKRLEIMASVVIAFIESINSLDALLRTADINEVCLQTVKEGIIHVNFQGIIQKINNYAATILNNKPEKIIGASINEALENHLFLLQKFWESVTNKAQKTETNITINKKSAEVLFFRVSGLEQHSSYLIFIRL